MPYVQPARETINPCLRITYKEIKDLLKISSASVHTIFELPYLTYMDHESISNCVQNNVKDDNYSNETIIVSMTLVLVKLTLETLKTYILN